MTSSGDLGNTPCLDHPQDNFDQWKTDTSDYWAKFVTPEPISRDLREKVREDLRKQWYSELLLYFRRVIHTNWTMSGCRTLLDSELGDINGLESARRCCNRPSAFYWLPDAEEAAKGEAFCRVPTVIFASIFGEWHRQYNNQPNIDFSRFVTNPIQIIEGGPRTIRGIIQAHASILEKAKSVLHRAAEQKAGLNDVEQEDHPKYTIHPLYAALVLICDQNDLSHRTDEFRRPDGYLRVQDIAHFQSLIIARTGAEAQLSAPISFKSLRSKALPLGRDDFDGDPNVNVIRVPLPDAVRFVTDLEKQEDALTPGTRTDPTVSREYGVCCSEVFDSDRGCCRNQHIWADQHIIAAERHGYQHCSDLANSLRRVQAEMQHEIYHLLSPHWFVPRLVDYEGDLGPQL